VVDYYTSTVLIQTQVAVGFSKQPTKKELKIKMSRKKLLLLLLNLENKLMIMDYHKVKKTVKGKKQILRRQEVRVK
jgi:hypothetical protein